MNNGGDPNNDPNQPDNGGDNKPFKQAKEPNKLP